MTTQSPGANLRADIIEQPQVLLELLRQRADIIAALRARIKSHDGFAIIARGSSSHAAVTGKFLLDLAVSGRPSWLVTPSVHTLYHVRHLDYTNCVAVVVSQSGETPEILTTLDYVRDAVTIAITNHADSSLGRRADVCIELGVGDERAIPTTKTFTAQLLAFVFLAEAFGKPLWDASDLAQIPTAMQAAIDDWQAARETAQHWSDAESLIAVGYGFLHGIALEAAHKVQEGARMFAHGFSASDLRHGPIAIVRQGTPALTFNALGPSNASMSELIQDLRERGASVACVSAGHTAELSIQNTPEPLAIFPAVIRTQQIMYELALARGLDPDAPEGLPKVTRAL